MNRVKARQDFMMLDVATRERFKNRGAFRAWKLTFDTVLSIGLAQSLAAALLLRGADFRSSGSFLRRTELGCYLL